MLQLLKGLQQAETTECDLHCHCSVPSSWPSPAAHSREIKFMVHGTEYFAAKFSAALPTFML